MSSGDACELEEANRALDTLGLLSRPVICEGGRLWVRPQLRDKTEKAERKESKKRSKEERLATVHARQEEALKQSKKKGMLRKRNVYNADGTKRGKHSSSAPRKATEDFESGGRVSSEQSVGIWDEVEEEEIEGMYMWQGDEGGHDDVLVDEPPCPDAYASHDAAPLYDGADEDEELQLALQLSRMEFEQHVDSERQEIAAGQEYRFSAEDKEEDPDLLLAIELSRQAMECAQDGACVLEPPGLQRPSGAHYYKGRGPANLGTASNMLDAVDIGDEVEIEPEQARSSVVPIRTRGTVQEIIGWDHTTGDLRVVLEEGVVGSLRKIVSV